MLRKNIPNFITLGNLLCGALAIDQIYKGNLVTASQLIGLAALLDFMDGFVARLLKVHSPMGKELDSLADMVTFGLAPSLLLIQLFPNRESPLKYLMFLVALAGAWRLAKFNIDTRQSDSFLGLPIPANALFISALPLIFQQNTDLAHFFTAPVYIVIAVFLALMMVVELPMFALKFKKFSFLENKVRYLFLLSALALLFSLKFIALPIIVIFYILISLVIYLSRTAV